MQGDGHRVGNMALIHGTELWRDAVSMFPCQFHSRSGGGVVSLWTKPTGNQITLSSPTGKSHQPSMGTPPAQRGGLDREDSSPASLEGVGVAAAATELRTNRAITEVPPPGKHPLVGDTEAASATATECPPEIPSSQEHPLLFPLGLSLHLHVGPSAAFSCTPAMPAWGHSPSTQSWSPDERAISSAWG